MSCARTQRLLDAWLDQELDRSTHAEIGAHVKQCPKCAALRAERRDLHAVIQAADLRMKAPSELVSRVRLALASAAPRAYKVTPRWTIAVAASVGAFAGAIGMLVWLHLAPFEAHPREAVSRHVAAMAMANGRPEHLVQISAPDHHVVKPWFQGQVDFAPPVRELADEGFTLLGGRVERFDDHAAAVIVYRIRNHPIELFVWRFDGGTRPLRLTVDRGFGVASWAANGLRLVAVSDVDLRDLDRFAQSVQASQAVPR